MTQDIQCPSCKGVAEIETYNDEQGEVERHIRCAHCGYYYGWACGAEIYMEEEI